MTLLRAAGETLRGRSAVARLLRGLVLPALAAAAVSALLGCGGEGTTVVGATRGALAPSFSGQTLEGATLSSEGFRGKPLFLIYATSG